MHGSSIYENSSIDNYILTDSPGKETYNHDVKSHKHSLNINMFPQIIAALNMLNDTSLTTSIRCKIYDDLIEYVYLISPTDEFKNNILNKVSETDYVKNFSTYFTLAG